MRRTVLAIVALLLFSTPAVAQRWDQVNGSMQVKSGPTAPLVIIDQTTAGQKILSLRTNGTEKCSVNVSGDFTCIGTMTLGPSGVLTVSSTAVTSTVPLLLGGASASGANGNIFLPNGGDVGIAFRNAANNASPATIQMDSSDRLYFRNTATGISRFDTVVDATGGFRLNGVAVMSATAPTVPVACTTPTVTWSNGTAAFQIDVGGTCAGVSTLVVTMPAASNAWMCDAMNVTTSATGRMEMTASTSTSVTFTSYTRTTGVALVFVDGTDVRIKCSGG